MRLKAARTGEIECLCIEAHLHSYYVELGESRGEGASMSGAPEDIEAPSAMEMTR